MVCIQNYVRGISVYPVVLKQSDTDSIDSSSVILVKMILTVNVIIVMETLGTNDILNVFQHLQVLLRIRNRVLNYPLH